MVLTASVTARGGIPLAARPLAIVVACTNNKRLTVPEQLAARTLPTDSLTARQQEWIRRLCHSNTETLPAADLYCGDHWTVAKTLPTLAATSDWSPELWITSAGYGLVHAWTPLAPYSA